MTRLVTVRTAALIALTVTAPAHAQSARYALINGRWFDGRGFVDTTFYTEHGRFTARSPAAVDSVIDLAGAFVIPPLGEAHVHDLNEAGSIDERIDAYLERGVYYVLVQDALFEIGAPIRSRINRPATVDVVYAEGVVTPSWHDVTAFYERLAAEGAFGARRTLAELDGRELFLVDSLTDLDAKWDAIVARNADVIKVLLSFSEAHHERLAASDTSAVPGPGIDPVLLPEIVRRAHAAGRRISVHIETAADFRWAVAAGADLIAHLPGWRIGEAAGYPEGVLEPWRLTAADARAAAARGVVVVTTARPKTFLPRHDENRPRFAELHRSNLLTLQAAGVVLAPGSDDADAMLPAELDYLRDLDVFDNLALVRLATETTPRVIFPTRRIGRLAEGYEASFLALDGDPTIDLASLGRIRLRMKQGGLLVGRATD